MDIVFANGDKYAGNVDTEYRPHGRGIYQFNDGEMFSGEYINGERMQGELRTKDGVIYNGTFKNNLPDGKGKATLVSKSTFEGTWESGFPK